jgi:D-glycero-D-manno-heptose 1,7-bisphosphate phosphatase
MTKEKLQIDDGWTLFLDRDGVINKKIEGEYVRNFDEFHFMDHALEAIAKISAIFGKIVIVTNQQGVGKGLMKLEELHDIHNKMMEKIAENQGRIDNIYYCTATREEDSFFRKPNVGMALRAKKDFPDIFFKKSVIVGDSISDMQFGKKMRMNTVFITSDLSKVQLNPFLIDYVYPDLMNFANDIVYKPA